MAEQIFNPGKASSIYAKTKALTDLARSIANKLRDDNQKGFENSNSKKIDKELKAVIKSLDKADSTLWKVIALLN